MEKTNLLLSEGPAENPPDPYSLMKIITSYPGTDPYYITNIEHSNMANMDPFENDTYLPDKTAHTEMGHADSMVSSPLQPQMQAYFDKDFADTMVSTCGERGCQPQKVSPHVGKFSYLDYMVKSPTKYNKKEK